MLAITYVGGEVAQTTVQAAQSRAAGIFQAMMLFFMLASDILVRYRVRIVAKRVDVVRRGALAMSIGPIDCRHHHHGRARRRRSCSPALGELVVEKSGVLNLGVEGMMLVGAIARFAVTVTTGNPGWRSSARPLRGAAASLIFAVLTLSLSANQVATGLALTIFGTGFSALVGQPFTGTASCRCSARRFRRSWRADPIWRVIFGYSPLVYFSLFMVVVVWLVPADRRGAGLILRAVGENDLSAHSIGYSVIGVRYAAVAFGGAMAGIGGRCFPAGPHPACGPSG